ncbi:MAG: DnaT-like ssDNA-binding domain-containing protein [Succinatimonas hippei]|nr:DnaT-like ssDNA-binding domain-containing protein [Succinatimonas hippei]
MNALELKNLTSGAISHIARSLYAFFLRPRAERGITLVSLSEVCAYLACRSSFFPTSDDLRIATLALEELEMAGFIRRVEKGADWNGAQISYPLFTSELNELPSKPFQMTLSWRPGASFEEACRTCGLSDCQFEEHELTGFRTYWASRPELRSQIAWERAFAQRLSRSRSARVSLKRKAKAQDSDSSTTGLFKAQSGELFKAQS